MLFVSVLILIAMARRKLETAEAAIELDAEIPDGYQLPPVSVEEYDGGVGLRKFILSKYKTGQISARDVCGIAFWSTRAGASGVEDLAKDPRLEHGGTFTTKVLSATGARAKSSFLLAKCRFGTTGLNRGQQILIFHSISLTIFLRTCTNQRHKFLGRLTSNNCRPRGCSTMCMWNT
jgi:hypothetical protein